MKKNKFIVFPLILSLVFFFGMIGILIVMNSIDKLNEKNTTEFAATVSNIEVTNTGEDIYIDINTYEYGDTLFLSNVISENIDLDDANSLQEGQKIFFRVENYRMEQLIETGYGCMVSLRTEGKELFSLSSYNEKMHKDAFPARIAAMVFAFIFLMLSVHCILLLKGINIFKRSKK